MPPLRKYIAYVLGDAIPTALAAALPPNLHAKFHLDRSSRLATMHARHRHIQTDGYTGLRGLKKFGGRLRR